MGEKRKPVCTFFVRYLAKSGDTKKRKVELFPAMLWGEKFFKGEAGDRRIGRYRVRIDGTWYGSPPVAFSQAEIQEKFFKSFPWDYWSGYE